jgi:hypothetical protein
MERSTIFNQFGKPSISIRAIYTMAMLNYQRVMEKKYLGILMAPMHTNQFFGSCWILVGFWPSSKLGYDQHIGIYSTKNIKISVVNPRLDRTKW